MEPPPLAVPADGIVSTGDLPAPARVRTLLTDAYERYRHADDDSVMAIELNAERTSGSTCTRPTSPVR